MGSNSSSAGGSDAGFENTKRSKVSTATKVKIAAKKITPLPVKIFQGIVEGAKTARTNRMLEGTSDFQGTKSRVATPYTGGGDNDRGGNQVVTAPTQAVATAPTTAEVSQSTTTEATPEEDILYRKRKTKRVGRSPTIMTGVTGVTGGLTLGKPSLLGRA
jgi:hypothetical protein